ASSSSAPASATPSGTASSSARVDRRPLLVSGIGLARDLGRLAFALAHDLEAVSAEDELVDVVDDVARRDDEVGRLRPDPLVLLRGQAHALNARLVAALAQVVAALQHGAEAAVQLLDPLVHLAEERLVLADPPFTLAHDATLP